MSKSRLLINAAMILVLALQTNGACTGADLASATFYCNNNGDKTACTAGYYCTGGGSLAVQTVCPEGKISAASQSSCTSCAAGKYVNNNVCLNCPAGKYALAG